MAIALALQPDVGMADKPNDDFNLGVGLWRNERWAPAADAFVQFLKEYPDHPRVPLATFYLGSTYGSLQKYGQSRDHFKEFLRLSPDGPNTAAAKYRLGECSYYLGEFEKAVAQLEAYTREYPGDKLIDWGYLQLGESLIQVERFPEADGVLNKLLAASASDSITGQAEYSLALSLEKQQKLDAAVEAYRKVARQNDVVRASRALARAGTVRFRQQRYENAAALYDQIASRFPESRLAPSASLNAGLALYRVANFEGAIRRFEQVADDAAEKTEATLLTGKSLARLKRLDAARSTLKVVLDTAGDSELAAEAIFEMARLEQVAGENGMALKMYMDLIDRWPNDSHTPDALFNAANLQLELADAESAGRLLSRLRSEFPAHAAKPRAKFLTGRILLEQKNPAAAREAISEVVSAENATPRLITLSLYYIARIDHEQKQFLSALQAVQRLRPMLDRNENRDLRGGLALGAMSAIELADFKVAEELATEYLRDGQKGAQAADALAARTIARASTGNYDDAMTDVDQLIETAAESPQTWTAILQAAELAWDKKAYAAALGFFRRTNSDQAPALTRRAGSSGTAWCLFHQKDFKNAAQVFGETARAWPESSAGIEARYMAVRSLQEDGQTDTAIDGYAVLSKDFADRSSQAAKPELLERLQFYSVDAGRTAARLLDAAGRREESNQQWAALADRFPDAKELDEILDEWAWLNLKADQFPQADAVYRRLLKERPESPFAGTARLSLAESELNAERMEDAIREFQAIIANPRYGESEKAKAMYHLTNINLEQQSWKQVSDLAARFATAHSGSSLAPRVQLMHADALLALNLPDKARELLDLLRRGVLERHLEADPWTERIWIVLGEVALASKDYEVVDSVAEEFARQFPKSQFNFQMKYVQGRRWKNQPEPHFVKARKSFEEAIYDEVGRGTRTAARSQFLIADMRLMERDYAGATREYLKVWTLYSYPDLQAQALHQAAECQWEMGQPKEAIQTWQSLIEDFPKSPLAEDARQRVQEATAESAVP